MNTTWMKDFSFKLKMRPTKSFKSYVDIDPDSNQESTYLDTNEEPRSVELTYLPGEILVAEVNNVVKFKTLSDLKKGVLGNLVCTNYRVAFLSSEEFPSNLHQRNLLLGENDICLMNIDAVYQVSNGKRKKLTNIHNNDMEIVEIHCKDFRIYSFSFKFTRSDSRTVLRAILQYAFPLMECFLFAFSNKEPEQEPYAFHSYYYTQTEDWNKELARCHCPGWRVTVENEKFLLCDSLPESFVVPAILLDKNLIDSAPYFLGNRVPTWSWGLPSGASIVRMAAADPNISMNEKQLFMFDIISRTNPHLPKPQIFNLDELCPSVKDLQNSFLKIKEICMPTSVQEYWEHDCVYLSKLEASKWLHHVSSCLRVAVRAVLALQEDTTVIFIEYKGRDMSCVLSSLVQLFLDSTYRSQSGFQYLIQKEWIALGHPFTQRLRHLGLDESEESPVFLLFLDCVWQLMQQCPTTFEFSEIYLTSIWDSCHNSIFDTFLFDSSKYRQIVNLKPDNGYKCAWNWSRQFPPHNTKLFKNPLFILNKYLNDHADNGTMTARPKSFSTVVETRKSHDCLPTVSKFKVPLVSLPDRVVDLLKIDPSVQSLSFWNQCFFRWLPMAQVVGGGPPILFLQNMKLADEIEAFEKASSSSKSPNSKVSHRRAVSVDTTRILHCSESPLCIGPCHDMSGVITSAFPYAPVAPCEWTDFQCVPSSACVKLNYTSDDDLGE